MLFMSIENVDKVIISNTNSIPKKNLESNLFTFIQSFIFIRQKSSIMCKYTTLLS